MAMRGLPVDMGVVVLKCGETHIVCSRRRAFCWEPEFYRCMGLEPAAMRIMGVKSSKTFVPNYRDLASAFFWLDTSGPSSHNFATLPWQQINRSMWPLDENMKEPSIIIHPERANDDITSSQ